MRDRMRDRGGVEARPVAHERDPKGWIRDRVPGHFGYVRLRLQSRDRFRIG